MDMRSKSPYTSAMEAWLASNRQDKSLLLRGQALQDARGWVQARSENLSHDELQFLYASTENALEQEQKAKQRRLSLPPLLRNFKRKAFLIIGVTSVVAGTVFYWTKTTISPEYEGSFRVLVEPVRNEARVIEPSGLARPQEPAPSKEMSNLDYATQLEILNSPRMLSRIYEKVKSKYRDLSYFELEKKLTVERLFREKSSEPTLIIKRLFGEKNSEPTKILEVRYAGEDPQQVKFVLGVVADEYLKYSLTERTSRINQGSTFIDEQLQKELNPRVDSMRSRLLTLQIQYNYKPNSEPRVARDYIVARQYSEIQEELEKATKKRNQLLEQREALRIEAAHKQYPWELVSGPSIATDSKGNLISAPGNFRNIQIGGVVLGLLLGVGATAIIENKGSNLRFSNQLRVPPTSVEG